MRIIIIIGLLALSGCSTWQTQNAQYNSFAGATKNMVSAMTRNIAHLQQLETEALHGSLALSFVRGGELQVPESLLAESLSLRLEFLQNLEKAVEAMVFDETLPPPQQNRLNRLAKALHAKSHSRQINQALQESHAVLHNAIAVMVADWQSESLQSLASDIVAKIHSNEKRLLLLARDNANTSLLELHERTKTYLQNDEQRRAFLQNWQAMAELAEKMQMAHLSLALGRFDGAIERFYRTALELNHVR